MSKRGVSTIVGTMLVVLLTIVAAGILWILISKFSNPGEGSSQDCLTTSLEVISCGYAKAGCYNSNGAHIQVPTTSDPGMAWALVRRNNGAGSLQTVKLIFDVNGQKSTGDIIDYNLPELRYRFRKDLSALKELATADVATTQVAQVLTNYLANPGPIKATVAAVVGDNIVCDPNPKLVTCDSLPPSTYLGATCL